MAQDTTGSTVASELEGPGIDQTYWRTEVGGSTINRSYLSDGLGSTVALTDGSATPVVKTTYTYEPYGTPTTSGIASTNAFEFTGREWDGATGLQYNRTRYLSPTFGRFISRTRSTSRLQAAICIRTWAIGRPASLIRTDYRSRAH